VTATADISSTTDRMRETLAFALNALDAEGLEPYMVEAMSGGERLSIYLADPDSQDAGRRLFAALGGHRCKERQKDKTWSIFSSGASEWNPGQEFARPNVPLGDRMIEVAITCSVTPDPDVVPSR
jgi:hypothetical protein